MEMTGYAVEEAGGPLSARPFDTGALRPNDVLLRISHCGVCFSDIDLIDDKFGAKGFPLVPGHEAVGIVEAVGPAVTLLRVGDRAGVGPIQETCGHCEQCTSGHDIDCPTKVVTARPRGLGGFSSHIRVDERFAFPIPAELRSEHAGPLLCAGLTTFSALRNHARVGMRVGVLGVGGLGHLAVQFAHKMGLEVTTFALGLDETEAARHRRLGASRTVNLDDEAQVKAAAASLDLLVFTAYGAVDWMRLLGLLRPRGRILVLGASLAPLNIPAGILILGSKSIAGSAAGNRKDMTDMLRFCAEFGVAPEVETLPMANVNEAIAKVRAGTVRYRMVVEA